VEGGFVKTAALRIGNNVTVGLGSVIEIDVEVGEDCQIGALSFVPKHARLEKGAIFAGIPVERIGTEIDARRDRSGPV
jgi:carbonic anhydrase/acetyltransferase-like protein (isoleucine patch superfamily)